MALDAALVIRIGSAALFILLGIAVAALGWRKRGPLALGVFLLVTGAVSVYTNLASSGSLLYRYEVAGPLAAILVSSAIGTAIFVPRPMTRREVPAIVAGLVVAAIVLLSWRDVPLTARTFGAAMFRATLSFFVVTAATRLALAPPTDRAGWTRGIALTTLVGPYLILLLPTAADNPSRQSTLLAEISVVLSLSAAWLVAGARTGHRVAHRGALAWPALGLAAYLYLLVPGNTAAVSFDIYGVYGVVRVIGWAGLVYAILRADLLGLPLPRLAQQRGTLAAGALAALFIVAQIAQNFFSASYGLLTGGIVAGAFLFAAQPIQRAMERMGDATAPRPDLAAPGRSAGREEIYRKALRIALVDRRVSRDEELHLFQLAEELGIGAGRAMALRHEIESEKERAP